MSGFDLLLRKRRNYDGVKDPGLFKKKRVRTAKPKSPPPPATEFIGTTYNSVPVSWVYQPVTGTNTLVTTTGTAAFTTATTGVTGTTSTLTQPMALSNGDSIQYRYVLSTDGGGNVRITPATTSLNVDTT